MGIAGAEARCTAGTLSQRLVVRLAPRHDAAVLRDTFVLLGAHVSADALERAFYAVLVDAGHVAVGTEVHSPVRERRREADESVCVAVAASKDRAMGELVHSLELAPALARSIAACLGAEVALFTLVAEVDARGELECRCEELRVDPRGTVVRGRFGDELEHEFGRNEDAPEGRWGDLCDGKPHHAMGALIDAAKAAFFETRELDDLPEPASLHVYRAPSLGVPRLDDLVRRIRAAGGAEVRVVHGRVALRFGPPSATQTAFVKDGELTALSRVLGTSLVDRREE